MTLSLAPLLPDSLEWLDGVPRVTAQRGWLTAIAFVNAGSAWSQQRLLDLQALRARHPQCLRVLVVHVPRFDHERAPARVRAQFEREGVRLPVAVDRDWVAWQHYGIAAWPTIVLVDGEGHEQARVVGDEPITPLDAKVRAYEAELLPDIDPEPEPDLRAQAPATPLRYPVGLAVAPQRLYVADSGHHRVLECAHDGRILRQFGSGAPAFVDGSAEQAAFCRPHGLCLLRDVLYVADTGNHAVRRINLRSGEIDTLCGNGKVGRPQEGPVEDPRMRKLDSPRALVVLQDQLFIAMAGDNRIWSLGLGRHELVCRAGSGELTVRDGSGAMAAFAQPVALAGVQHMLYVCDAAGSAIRALHLRDNTVQTLVGQGPWQFGDADGPRQAALLQEPQAIALDPDAPVLWIADCGNQRLRSLRLGGGELATFPLSRPLQGPAGLAAGKGALWIADTEGHTVLCLDTGTGELREVPVGE